MFVVPFVLMFVTQGQSYYIAPAYPMLFGGGAVVVEAWLDRLSGKCARIVQGLTWGTFAASGAVFALVALPIAPINSPLWDAVSDINGKLKEMVGWPELVDTVAGIYSTCPPRKSYRQAFWRATMAKWARSAFTAPRMASPSLSAASTRIGCAAMATHRRRPLSWLHWA